MFYPKLPHDVNSPVHPVSAMDFMPVEQLRQLQLHRLQWTVKYAFERVPLFRKRCDEKGVRPEHIKTLADIKHLPFSMKTDLRDEYPMGLRAADMDEIVRFHCSSGTTGKPICIPNTLDDIAVWQNGAMRCLAMYGIRAGDVLQVSYGYGLFTGGLGLHYGGEGMGCAVLPTSGGNTERQVMLMRDLGVTAIACTPSYFLRIIDEAKRQGVDFRRDTKLKHGIFGAEPWTKEMREVIERETGITAHDIYGLTEIAGPGVAGDCDEHNGLHIWEDHFYPEIIDPDTLEPLPDGEVGELVFTTITRRGTPMIRYRTRDLTRLRTEK
ncbi:MAG: phenylacetate--CoA ligase, partial [Kiritimatiellae bacterium]|nr:phenylacetate--CoA ligase [Kiritimatiellia bacterium]